MDDPNTVIMEEAIEKLMNLTKRELDSIEDEIRGLSCETNPHPDDVSLCEKLEIKSDDYKKFLRRLRTISIDHHNDL